MVLKCEQVNNICIHHMCIHIYIYTHGCMYIMYIYLFTYIYAHVGRSSWLDRVLRVLPLWGLGVWASVSVGALIGSLKKSGGP